MKREIGVLAAASTIWCAAALPVQAAASAPANIGGRAQPPAAASALEKITSDKESGITEYRLKSNGLQVLLAERPQTPIVTVMVVYHVGSRNEGVGYTGATHFLEHMMFRGTKLHDPLKGTGIDDVLKPIGGINNASTYYDRTNYYEIVPAQYMGVCLELEADRMRGALLRESDQKSEMTVVRNELERDEDDPSRLIEVNEFAHAFMAHPYHHPVIGWRSDVENVPISRLRQFYDQFYYPNNATLLVIGDFRTGQALHQIAGYFGSVPASARPFPKVYTTEPPQQGERRFIVRRGADLPKVTIGFHIPRSADKDSYALEVLASLLGDDKRQSSRLYKTLIDTSMASDCYAYNYSLRDPSLFTLQATATPGTDSEKIEAALYDQVQALAHAPVPDAELEQAKKSVWKRMKLDASDPIGMSSQLAEAIAAVDWQWGVNFEKNIRMVTKADVQRVAAKYFSKNNETVGYYYPVQKPALNLPAPPASLPGAQGLLDVPAAAVAPPAVAARPLWRQSGAQPPQTFPDAQAEAHALPAVAVGSLSGQTGVQSPQPSGQPSLPVAPAGKTTAAVGDTTAGASPSGRGQSGTAAQTAASDAASRGASSPATSTAGNTASRRISSIASQVHKQVLANGLTVLVMPVPGSGVVSIAGKIRAGDYFHPQEARCLPDFLADMLDKGSQHWSKEALAQQLELMGSSLDFDSETFFLNFESDVVQEDVPQYLSMIADVIKYPLFLPAELEKSKKQMSAQIEAATSDTSQVATNAFYNTIYKPDCVYYQKRFAEQQAELSAVTVASLREFHHRQITPANTVLAIVGDIDPNSAFELVKKNFSDWQGGQQSKIDVSDCLVPALAAQRINEQLADKTDVEVMIGRPVALDIKSPDFDAACLANAALGHDTVSSRLAELRNKYGLTYGISSYFTENSYANAPWIVDFTVNPSNLDRSLPIVHRILQTYRKQGITATELSDEASRLSGEYIIERMRSPHQLANALTRYEMLGLGARFMDEYPSRLKRVTVQQANAAIKKYFDPDQMLTAVAGTISGATPAAP